MANEVKILVACGSGVATSTVAQEAVKKILAEANIPGKIFQIQVISEIPLKQNDVDLILTTTNYRKPVEKPCISVFGLISGINEGKIKQSIIDECHKILGE